MDKTLLDAYARTAFMATAPTGRITIRVGQCCPELDELMTDHRTKTWAYVTAFNPGSVLLTAEENARRQRQLERTVAELGFVLYPGEGTADDRRWPSESSLLILGIGRSDAIRLGHRFGQLAVVYGELGQEAQLLVCGNLG